LQFLVGVLSRNFLHCEHQRFTVDAEERVLVLEVRTDVFAVASRTIPEAANFDKVLGSRITSEEG
jgi:hypothetical protein